MQSSSAEEVFNGLEVFTEGSNIEIGEKIGSGGQGLVSKAKLIPTGKLVAVKQYKFNDFYDRNIATEIGHLRKAAGHVGIIQLLGIYETSNNLLLKGLVLEFCAGGSMDQELKIIKIGTNFDQKYKWIVQIIEAVKHLHDLGIIHRDLKPANILFTSDEQNTIKLCDFAECTTVPTKLTLVGNTSDRGTPGFRASEIEAGNGYGDKADVFSLGRTILNIIYQFGPDNFGVDFFKLFSLCISKGILRKLTKPSHPSLEIIRGLGFLNESLTSLLEFLIELNSLAGEMCSVDVANRPTLDAACLKLHELFAKPLVEREFEFAQDSVLRLSRFYKQFMEVVIEKMDQLPEKESRIKRGAASMLEICKNGITQLKVAEEIGQEYRDSAQIQLEYEQNKQIIDGFFKSCEQDMVDFDLD